MTDYRNLTELEINIKHWGGRTFPTSTIPSTWIHFEREVQELKEEIQENFHMGTENWEAIEEEIADIFHLLCQISRFYDISITEAVHKKFEKNLGREWQLPDTYGVVEHKRTEDSNG